MCQRGGKKKAALIKTALRYGAAFCPSLRHRLHRPQAPSARCYSKHCCFSTSTEISAPTQVSGPRSTRSKFSPLFSKAAHFCLFNITYNGGCLKETMMRSETGVHPHSNMWVLQWKHACRCAEGGFIGVVVHLSIGAHLRGERWGQGMPGWPGAGLQDAPPASCLVCRWRVKERQTCPVTQHLQPRQHHSPLPARRRGTLLSPWCSLQCRQRSRLFLCGHIKRAQWKRCGIYSERWQELRCSLVTLWCFFTV